LLGHGMGDGRFARAGRSVDRDDHAVESLREPPARDRVRSRAN
jgi:hypothetical protein